MAKAARKAEERQVPEAVSKRKPRRGPASGLAARDLDRVIHERVRLGIVSALAVNDTMSFNELKDLLGTTDGNLSVHARKLEEAEYIDCRKMFEGRVPRTEFSLTRDGRKALEQYLEHMEALIRAVKDP